MSEIKLLPCPFCGGNNVGVWHNNYFRTCFEVRCYDCHFGLTEVGTEAEAIKTWNTRKPMERIAEQIEFLEHRTIDGVPYINMNDAIEVVKEEGGIE